MLILKTKNVELNFFQKSLDKQFQFNAIKICITLCAVINIFQMDAFVVIACPESEIFDSRDFLKPLLLPYEVDLAFNSSREFSQNYCTDFNQILPGGLNYVSFEASTEPDISLISGGVRGSKEDEPSSTEMNAVACTSDGTVAIGKAGASFLQSRSWKGLEQRLGQDEVKPAVKGRSGIAMSYENEPINKET